MFWLCSWRCWYRLLGRKIAAFEVMFSWFSNVDLIVTNSNHTQWKCTAYLLTPNPPIHHPHPAPSPTPNFRPHFLYFLIYFYYVFVSWDRDASSFLFSFNPRSLNPPGDGNLRSSANCTSMQESGGPLHHKKSNTGPRLNQCSYITYQRCFQPKASFRGSISVSTLIIIVLGVICLVPIAFASRANWTSEAMLDQRKNIDYVILVNLSTYLPLILGMISLISGTLADGGETGAFSTILCQVRVID